MKTYCGADCEVCDFKENCKGCLETCGSPFGGRCVAAEYIKAGGREAYQQFKEKLTEECNALLGQENIGRIDGLAELVGAFVNMEYTLPNGGKVKFLDDKNVYLGAQIEVEDTGLCYGVAADTNFILICSYLRNGGEPELITYHRR